MDNYYYTDHLAKTLMNLSHKIITVSISSRQPTSEFLKPKQSGKMSSKPHSIRMILGTMTFGYSKINESVASEVVSEFVKDTSYRLLLQSTNEL